MGFDIKKIALHLVVMLLFMGIALAYFYPVLQGKKIIQGDIMQYRGMAREQTDFREETGEETYWTNNTFGGMPTYQIGAQYPHHYIKKLDRLIRFLPRPADYLWLYLAGFYVLLLVLKVNWRLAFLGALAFGFSTYLMIILGEGHNSKANAIGYLPLVLAGMLLVFQRKYIWGFLLTTVAMALEISANHLQMTYYGMLLVLILGIVYGLMSYRRKTLPRFFTSVGLISLAVLLSLMLNATGLLATQEYSRWSTRGKSELTINPDGTPKAAADGLSKEYITSYSYGIAESLNLFVPRLFGGSNREALGEGSKTYSFLVNQGVSRSQAKDFTASLSTYWGDQAFVAAPAYIGAVVVFLFVLALFLVKGPLKWWLVAGTLLSLFLSWGKNFGLLTDLMIDYFPLYNKFRAVASVQVILELCIPVLAIVGLVSLFKTGLDKSRKMKAFKWSALIVSGVLVLLFLLKGMFNFEGVNDEYYRAQFTQMGLPQLMDIIILDRKAIYNQDLFRSLIFVLLTAGVLWLFLREKLKQGIALTGLGLLLLTDLVGVDRRYVNEDNFISGRKLDTPFQATAADTEILKDTAYFRVFEPELGLAGARTSYFHNALGGYHAAKPRRFQDLYDFHIAKNNVEVLHMLNVKYVLQRGENGAPVALSNPYANGNAWFVEKVRFVSHANEEIQALDSLDTKCEAVVNRNDISGIELPESFQRDSTAYISLLSYRPNRLKYASSNKFDGLVVFSDMYYPRGWKVTIDGKEARHFRVDYALRAMEIPAGNHTIEFRFQPEVVQTGSTLSLAGSLLLGVLFLGGLLYEFRKRKKRLSGWPLITEEQER